MRSIGEGTFSVGTLLPPESALCEHFSVSRATVREALRQLTDLGLVEKVHGVGTRVVATEIHNNYFLSAGSAELMQYGSHTVLELISREAVVVDDGNSWPEGLNAGERWLHLRGVRYVTGKERYPIAFSEIFLAWRFADVAPDLTAGDRPYHQLIADRYGKSIQSVDQEFTPSRRRPTRRRF